MAGYRDSHLQAILIILQP